MSAVDLLNQARAAGVDLYLAEGQVRYRGPDTAVETLIPELRRLKPELIDLLRMWANLEDAINTCCDTRGDTAENRAALLADCWHEPATKWAWLTWYFSHETMRTH